MTDKMVDLDALRDEHHPCWSIGGGYDVCSSCTTVRWPCDAHRLAAEVQRLTQERDQARDIAVALEQQTAEALRISRGCFFPERDVRPSMLVNRASIVELLRVLETENQ